MAPNTQRMQVSFSAIRTLLTALALAAAVSCNHSTGPGFNLSADRPDFDFGTIPDTTSFLNHTFTLRNFSPDTCYIKIVSKGCGCIDVDLDAKAIPPGKTAGLRMNVDLTGYFNHIDKPVYVYHSLSDKPLTLRLLADRPRQIPILSYDYPYSPCGDLRFTSNILFGGYVTQGSVYEATVIVYNDSDKPLSLRRISRIPKHIRVNVPGRVEPHSIARISAEFDFRHEKELFGEFSSELRLKDGRGNVIPLQLYAVVTESFDGDDPSSPRIHVPVTCYTLIESDRALETVSKTFRIDNYGDADLIIRSVSLSADDASYDLTDEVITPGDQAEMTVSIPKSSLGDGVQVNIICNDPQEPFKQLSIEPEAI